MNEREIFRLRVNTLAKVAMMLGGGMILGLVITLLGLEQDDRTPHSESRDEP
jgi:hypothetical protein